MNIQSFSIVVPNKACANKCPFCVSRMVNSDIYPNKMDINDPHYDINVKEYMKRMQYVANTDCNTVMLTGTSEPQQNKQFLATFALLNKLIEKPFDNIEMQTTGLLLTGNRNYLRFLRNFVGINTVALSINSINDDENNSILGHGLSSKIELKKLADDLADYDFNIRCCFNLNSYFNDHSVEEIISFAEDLHAKQITFRKLYTSGENTSQSKWIENHKFSFDNETSLYNVISSSKQIGNTPYGAAIRDIDGMSVIYDLDCMGKKPENDVLKYLILRPDCHLYSSWDTKASLVF